MQRNRMEGRRDSSRNAERDAAQPIGGQPRDDDDEDTLRNPQDVPSFLTAQELQARGPAKDESDDDEGDAGEQLADASPSGDKGESAITDDEPARGDRVIPEDRSEKLHKGRGGKSRR